MVSTKNLTKSQQDYLMSSLRKQRQELQRILFEIEKNDDVNFDFIQQSIKNVEVSLRQTRKFF